MGLVIFNPSQMTRTTRELAPPSPNCHIPTGAHRVSTNLKRNAPPPNPPRGGGSSVASGTDNLRSRKQT
ncbi:hypothetical protein TNCV_4786691 [Trichonephila clavipes]|nr:hypothetical protein TNCV_4786691 [Trichonephila clavipes]